MTWGIEAVLSEFVPAPVPQDSAVEFVLPVYLQFLSLSVVVGAGQVYYWRVAGLRRIPHGFNQPAAGAELNQVAGLGRTVRQRLGFGARRQHSY